MKNKYTFQASAGGVPVQVTLDKKTGQFSAMVYSTKLQTSVLENLLACAKEVITNHAETSEIKDWTFVECYGTWNGHPYSRMKLLLHAQTGLRSGVPVIRMVIGDDKGGWEPLQKYNFKNNAKQRLSFVALMPYDQKLIDTWSEYNDRSLDASVQCHLTKLLCQDRSKSKSKFIAAATELLEGLIAARGAALKVTL